MAVPTVSVTPDPAPSLRFPFPTDSPLLPSVYGDPFHEEVSGLGGYSPFKIIHESVIRQVFGPQANLEQAAKLFTFDVELMAAEYDRIDAVPGTVIPYLLNENIDQTAEWLVQEQTQFYEQYPNLPEPPACHVPNPVTKMSVPVLSAITALPTAVALPLQRFLGDPIKATEPGANLSHPAIRALSPYSNPENLANEIGPPLSQEFKNSAGPRRLSVILKRRACFAQKLLYRNFLAEKLGFKQMNFPNFRRAMLNRMLMPPGNYTHSMYLDPSTAQGILAVRRLLKQAFAFTGGKLALISVDFKTVKPRFHHSVQDLRRAGKFLKKIKPISGKLGLTATYYEKDQKAFAHEFFNAQNLDSWTNGHFPYDPENKLPKTSMGTRSLNTYINNFQADFEAFQSLDQDGDEAQERASYVCIIQLFTIGLAPLLLQVGHLSWDKLPVELRILLTSPKVRKVVIGRREMARAFLSSYDRHWDHRNGVIDIAEIAFNPWWKPKGMMGFDDFARLAAFQFWGQGGELLENRRRRMSLYNPLAIAGQALSSEFRSFLAQRAMVPYYGWTWLSLNNPDAFLNTHSDRTNRIQIEMELETANVFRKPFMLSERDFCSLWWQYGTSSTTSASSNGSVETTNHPMVRNLASEMASILAASPPLNQGQYLHYHNRYLCSRGFGLSLAIRNLREAIFEHNQASALNSPGGTFGITGADLYSTTDYSVGVQNNQPILMFSEYLDKDNQDGAEYLIHCTFAAAFEMADYRKRFEDAVIPRPSGNEFNLLDSMVLDNLVGQIIIRGSDLRTKEDPNGYPGNASWGIVTFDCFNIYCKY